MDKDVVKTLLGMHCLYSIQKHKDPWHELCEIRFCFFYYTIYPKEKCNYDINHV